MPFGVTAAVAGGLVEAGIGAATADILAAGIVGAGTGALFGGISSALSGGSFWKGAGKGALLGGVTGGIGGAVGGVAGGAVDQAAFMAGDDAADAAAGIGGAGASAIGGATDAAGAAINGAGSAASSGAAAAPAAANGAAAPAASSGIFGKIGDAVENNPLKVLQLALTAKQAFGAPQVNVGQNAANVIGTNPGFNASLPKYTMSPNTAAPYAGNWYTYGQSAQTPLYNSTLIPPVTQAEGGLVPGYSHGGKVNAYAMGGMPVPTQPIMASAPIAPAQTMGPRNPLATQNGFAIGKAIGQQLHASGTLKRIKSPKDAHQIGQEIGAHLASSTYSGDGQVPGHGTGQSDSVPARLSVDEYIVPADVVADLGDGSSKAGGQALDTMVKNIRAHKSVKGFPPKARNPLSYLSKGAV